MSALETGSFHFQNCPEAHLACCIGRWLVPSYFWVDFHSRGVGGAQFVH